MYLNKKAILIAGLILAAAVILSACGRSGSPKGSLSLSIGSIPEGDKAEWQSQTPADGDHVEAGSEFDITWYMLNTGTTTWTTDYSMRYFAGTNLTKPGKTRFGVPKTTAPGETVGCYVDAVAPWEPGTYQMFVVLSNANDENFSKVDITIIVDETEEK